MPITGSISNLKGEKDLYEVTEAIDYITAIQIEKCYKY